MLRIVDLAFERPVRSITDFADALGATYAGAANNLRKLIAHGVAEGVEELPEADPVSENC